MKKLLLILLCLPMIGFGQTKEVKVISNFDNGNIKKEEVYYNDALIEIKYYYENGNLKKSKPYKDGSKNGKYSMYYESGNLQYQGMLAKGQPIGKHHMYFETGEIKKLMYYSNDGSGRGEPISAECYDKKRNLITCEE